LVLIFFALEFLQRGRVSRRDWLMPRLVFALTAALVTAPLAIYFVNAPVAFSGRVQDVSIIASPGALVENAGRVAGMFFLQGDLEWRHNLAGRPALDALTVVPFILGLAVAGWHWRKLQAQLLMIWTAVMILPSVLSEQAPDFARAIGALPAVAILIGWGWSALVARLSQFQPKWEVAARPIAILLILVGSGTLTLYDYFGKWANDPRTFHDFEGGMTEIAQWLARAEESVYVPLDLYSHPTVQFLTRPRIRQVSGIDSGRTTPTADEGVVLVTPSNVTRPYVLLQSNRAILLPSQPLQLNPTEYIVGRYGNLVGLAPANRAMQSPAFEFQPFDAQFENGVQLVGYTVPYALKPVKGILPVILYWKKERVPPNEPKAFLQIVNAHGHVVAGVDALLTNGISIYDWKMSEVMPDQFLIPGENLEPGMYWLDVGLYDPTRDERWNVLGESSREDHIRLGPFRVPFAAPIPHDAVKPDAQWANGIVLRGYSTDSEALRSGQASEWTLYWDTRQPTSRDYTLFVHLLDSNGSILAQADHDPAQGLYPTSLWDVGETIPDSFTLVPERELAPGEYSVSIGWYHRETGERVPLAMSAVEGDRLMLTTFQVLP
jgi:hypothetical protein